MQVTSDGQIVLLESKVFRVSRIDATGSKVLVQSGERNKTMSDCFIVARDLQDGSAPKLTAVKPRELCSGAFVEELETPGLLRPEIPRRWWKSDRR